MNNKTHLKISTPNGLFFDDKVTIVTVKTLEGFIGLQANHTPFMSAVEIGELAINQKQSRDYKVCAISNGIVYANQTNVNIIAESVEFKENIDLKQAQQDKKVAEEKLKTNLSQAEQRQATIELKKALNRIKIKGEY